MKSVLWKSSSRMNGIKKEKERKGVHRVQGRRRIWGLCDYYYYYYYLFFYFFIFLFVCFLVLFIFSFLLLLVFLFFIYLYFFLFLFLLLLCSSIWWIILCRVSAVVLWRGVLYKSIDYFVFLFVCVCVCVCDRSE